MESFRSKAASSVFFVCLALLLALSTARPLGHGPERLHHHRHLDSHHGHEHDLISHANFSALYAFGDASVDAGNNNILPTPYKANHPPYGQNFRHGAATGRFSDGKLIADFLASHLGLKDALPAYKDDRAKVKDLLTGASFGNAGVGLIDLTSEINFIPMIDQQMDNFDQAVRTMKESVREVSMRQIVRDALYLISVGNNDMVDVYYNSKTGRRFEVPVPVQAYHYDMLRSLRHRIIERLYQRGARNFVVVGLPPIGGLPYEMTTRSVGNIVRSVFRVQKASIFQENWESCLYNEKLGRLISRLNSELSGIHVEYADIFGSMMEMMLHLDDHGLERVTEGCCGSGYIEMSNYCSPKTKTCANPERALSWDAMNPTQAANAFLAQKIEEGVLAKFQSSTN